MKLNLTKQVLIGSGSYGRVVRVNWKNAGIFFALKTFNDDKLTLKEVVNEIRLQKKVDFHENILRFCGITKKEKALKKYTLVLEYADGGTLKNYLNEHFTKLDWNDKYQLAFQLASAVACLHVCEIVHRDLHSSNVLIHQKRIKLADFGLSKKIAEASNDTSKLCGIIPYIDPKSLNDPNYKLNKQSDIYSIGVLMWQISSGCQPFLNNSSCYDASLILPIVNGKREEIIDGTPVEFSNLYTRCWEDEPNKRPNIQIVVSILENAISPRQHHDNTIDDEKEINSVRVGVESISISETSEGIIDLNEGLILSGSCMDLQHKTSSYQLNLVKENELNLNDLRGILVQEMGDFESIYYNIIIDSLITHINKLHDEGDNFDLIKQFIIKLQRLDHISNKLIIWLLRNQDKPQYIWILGLFYYCNNSIESNSVKAFQLFSMSTDKNYPIAQYYLAKCYHDGRGTEKDYNLAFGLYQKAAENECIISQLYLGYCYEFGIGTEINKEKVFEYYIKSANKGHKIAQNNIGFLYEKGEGIERDQELAVYWYEKAANNGYCVALYNLGQCYRIGKGVGKDETKAFSYYKLSADQEYVDAQFQLGYCYDEGIGTCINKNMAFYWYNKAAENGNDIARYNLAQFYRLGIGIIKNEIKAFELYKELSEKSHSDAQNNLGVQYLYGEGIEKNIDQAVYWLQEAADNKNEAALYNLGELFEYGIGVDKNEFKAFDCYKESAEIGFVEARFQLGYCYVNGIGTKIDKEKGLELYNKAAGKSYIEEEDDDDLVQVVHWYQRAAENDNKLALYKLGELYEFGIGVRKDEYRMFYFYKKSVDQGYNAQHKLKYCYEKGIGFDIDKEKVDFKN
ncbi:kinase-like domain-containing protein [Rhizophagus clarus]|uniref:Kinase-like domain-containing protein n=1 Tax=Rhizophagus clarus TaxID=94130 RepID=A0A8H3R0K8_9GLOM|nr:kinase-like domain-containing protein [Rhizophagus clarus]